MSKDAKIEFPSLDFPGRTTLYPHECATRIGCHVDHIYDLVEEGIIKGVNIAGETKGRRTVRIPIESWRAFITSRTTA